MRLIEETVESTEDF